MRITLPVLLLVTCSTSLAHADAAAPPASATGPKTPAAATAPARVVILGTVSRQYRRVCDQQMKETWVDPRLEVGWVPLVGANAAAAEKLVGKLSVVTGTAAGREAAPKADDEMSCPAYQMRSDMVVSHDGMRLLRNRSAAARGLAALQLEEARPFDGLSARREGDGLIVTFRNDLGGALRDLTITVHYEGCYGKPGSMVRTTTFARVAPGAVVRAKVPATLVRPEGRPGRHTYVARSIQLEGDGRIEGRGPIVFDADVSGAPLPPVACPDREPR